MAFSNTVLEAGVKGDGLAWEKGTFSLASVTTGTITAGSGTGFPANTPKVGQIRIFSIASDTDDVLKPAQDAGINKLKLTGTSNDTGTYYIEGPSAGQ